MKAFLPDETRLSQARLRTRNIETLAGFYTQTLGLQMIERADHTAALSATGQKPPLIVLEEEPAAVARPPRTVGLYHLAIRFPSRRDLAEVVQRLLRQDYPIAGASDHEVSEAIYLADPDNNGLELYSDRPRSKWVWRSGQIAMSTRPLDLEDLLHTLKGPPSPLAHPETDLGHIHLSVADLAAAERFYREFLGLAVTQRDYPGALFLSAGGYHHHLAVNTWEGGRPLPSNSTGLVSYRLEVPVREILYCLEHRAPLAAYTAGRLTENGVELLRIEDPNGQWLEVGVDRKAEFQRPESHEALTNK